MSDYRQKMMAFLKYQLNRPISDADEAMKKCTEQEFDKYIKDHYEVKGSITCEKIMKMKKKTEKIIPTEYEEQRTLVKWLRDNKIKCQSSGNGFVLDTKNNINYVSKLKASGMSVGYPDLDVFIGKGNTLHIEMKRIKGGVVSEVQKKWIDWFNANGYKAKVCYGAEEAINWVKENINE